MNQKTVFGSRHKPLGEINAMHRVKSGDVPLEIDTSKIRVKKQVRRIFNEDAHKNLVTEFRSIGQHTPALVRPDPENEGGYLLVWGERRLRACIEVGIKLKAFVREMDDAMADRLQFSENVQRENLQQIEIAEKLAEDYEELKESTSKVLEAIAERRSLSVQTVSEYLNYLRAAQGEGAAAEAVRNQVTADRQVVIGLSKLQRRDPELAAQALNRLSDPAEKGSQREVVRDLLAESKGQQPRAQSPKAKETQATVPLQASSARPGTAADYLATLHGLVVHSRRSPKTAIESLPAEAIDKVKRALSKHFKAGKSVEADGLGSTVLAKFTEGVFGVDGEGALNLLAFFDGMRGDRDELDLQALLAAAKR